MMSDIQKRISELREKILFYDAAYYGRGESLIPDKEYDELYQQLLQLERQYPELITADSPTRRIGSDLVKGFPKVTHSIPMMSIDNTYSEEDLRQWVERVEGALEGEKVEYCGELKVDGVAVALIYNNGILERAVTRGDGTVGDDVTVNAKTIRSIPIKVSYAKSFEVRGEIYMSFSVFEQLNQLLIENGQKPMQNPRNTASGTLKLLDPREVAKRKLSFAAHYLIDPTHKKSHYENLSFLQSLGFPVVVHGQKMSSFSQILEFCRHWENKRVTLDYPVDGVVVKVDELAQQQRLGATAKSPRWVIAYKYRPQIASTVVENIDAQVGRTGIITPVARLKPVFLAGTTIRNATLHNYDEIKRLDIRVGDWVEVEKAGEIIPKVVRVIAEKRPAGLEVFSPPVNCPSCNSILVKFETEVALRCVNSSCPARLFASLEHFVSRGAMNIENMGPALLAQLIERGLIKRLSDIFTLSEEKLITLERMGEKSARKIIASIQKAKNNPLDRLIYGLGIRLVGAQTSKQIASVINDIAELYTMSAEEIAEKLEVKTADPCIAQSIKAYFQNQDNRLMIEQLRNLGINLKGSIKTVQPGTLQGKTFVLTGTLSSMSREQATSKIESLGGKVSSSVSGKTNYVVVGTEPGSKLTKALKLGIKVLSEEEFLTMIKNHYAGQ